MSGLFRNAVDSIQLGVEDYQANDSKRAISAARNFYAGVLLLAKEVLVRQAPEADPGDVIGARYKPVPDGNGSVSFTPISQQTIDFTMIGERFKDFGLTINQSALKDLNQVRNNLEHYYSDKPHDAVREAIAKAFPVVVDLFRLINVKPYEVLGDAWQVMLDVRQVYESELNACRQTFDKVEWLVNVLAKVKFSCLECQSDLVAQDDPENTNHEDLQCRCRLCGNSFTAEVAIEKALAEHFEEANYLSIKDGGDQLVQTCPECNFEAYLLTEEECGCAWCGLTMNECARCNTGLTPENVSYDNHSLCSYCEHLMSKDD